MSAGSSAAGSGAVFGAVVIFLLQQLGFFSLSALVWAVVYLAVGVVIGGVLGGLIGRQLGRRR